MLKKPLVSVIIPVYNGENYMREAIDSALNQTYSNFEVIVVNDGSNDNGETEKIALSYGKKIRYFSKMNGGVATALNLGIKEMKGEYFLWLSHDDILYQKAVEILVDALTLVEDKKMLVFSNYDFLYEKSKEKYLVDLETLFTKEQLTNSLVPIISLQIYSCTILVHKSHFDRVGIFNTNLRTTQDNDLWFRMFRNQKRIYLRESLAAYRRHENQGMNTNSIFNIELEHLISSFMSKLTQKEIIEMYGSESNYYSKIKAFFGGLRLQGAYNRVCKKITETKDQPDTLLKIKKMKDYLIKKSGGKEKKICIFGAGQWGLQTYYELSDRMINIESFCDNDKNKYGHIINDKYCVSFNELKKIKDDILVIIAVKAITENIRKQLQDNDFKYIATKQEINKLFFDVPPAIGF